MKRTLIALSLVLLSAPSFAGWDIELTEDKMTDEKTGVIVSADDESNGVYFVFQCWDDKDKTIQFVLGTDEQFDKSATYPGSISVPYRFDKGQPSEIVLYPNERGGKLIFGKQLVNSDSEYKSLLSSISAVSNRIVIAIAGKNLSFSASNLATKLTELKKHCGMP